MTRDEAAAYCSGLSWGGLRPGSWHLPTIDELRSLVRGCPPTEIGGECPVTDSCDVAYRTDVCFGCVTGEGPGTGGCYMPGDVGGECGWPWSSSVVSGLSRAWFASFADGSVGYEIPTYAISVRCVRPGA